jgi:hypothetical protein
MYSTVYLRKTCFLQAMAAGSNLASIIKIIIIISFKERYIFINLLGYHN